MQKSPAKAGLFLSLMSAVLFGRGDLCCGHGAGLVGPCRTNVRHDGCDIAIAQRALPCGHLSVVGSAGNGDLTAQTVSDDRDDFVRRTGDNRIGVERREDAGLTFAVGLMTARAIGRVDFFTGCCRSAARGDHLGRRGRRLSRRSSGCRRACRRRCAGRSLRRCGGRRRGRRTALFSTGTRHQRSRRNRSGQYDGYGSLHAIIPFAKTVCGG